MASVWMVGWRIEVFENGIVEDDWTAEAIPLLWSTLRFAKNLLNLCCSDGKITQRPRPQHAF